MNKFDKLLNIGSMLILLSVIALGVYRLYESTHQEPNTTLRLGTAMPVMDGVRWPAAHQTLVLAMSVGCHWCRQSAAFYRDIVQSNSSSAVRLIAIFPNSEEDARAELRGLGIDIREVYRVSFGTLGIAGTPTLILLDPSGRIKSLWEGALSSKTQSEVFSKLGILRGVATASVETTRPTNPQTMRVPELSPEKYITVVELKQRMARFGNEPIVDTRPREVFSKGHISGAINIPIDELEVRAPHELPKGYAIIDYCGYCPPCDREAEQKGIASYCSLSEFVLAKMGFEGTVILKQDLDTIQKAGVATTK